MRLIMGLPWEQIQALQQKKSARQYVGQSLEKPKATDADKELLRINGVSGLLDLQFFGVLDRLINSGLVKKEVLE